MNDADQSLEADLRAMRPVAPSPGLKLRIAEALRTQAPAAMEIPTNGRRRGVTIGLVAAAVAAGLALAVLLPRPQTNVQLPDRPTTTNGPGETLAAAFADRSPSHWSYRQALTDSPEAADALLDEQSARRNAQFLEDRPERARVFLFAQFPSELDPPPGEL
jgi:hypothetical protein